MSEKGGARRIALGRTERRRNRVARGLARQGVCVVDWLYQPAPARAGRPTGGTK